MVQACIVSAVLIALVVMSLCANRRFSRERRLPMQWSASGAVGWTAPRPLALAFTPALAGAILIGMIVAMIAVPSRPGQEGLELPVVAIVSVAFVAAHAMHLWLIDKTLKARIG